MSSNCLVCPSHQLQVCTWSYCFLVINSSVRLYTPNFVPVWLVCLTVRQAFSIALYNFFSFSLSLTFHGVSRDMQLHCRPSELVVGGTLSLPRSHARILYLTALVTKALLGLAAWRLLQHGGLSPNLDAYGIYIILLSVGPLCRLYSCSSVRQKRNLCPDIAGAYYPPPCVYQVSQVCWGDHPRGRVETEDLIW